MVRDVARLTGTPFDLLVVGGGIYGLTLAYDAAQRGLSVALIERDDFGSGTSFNHLRTIHGGLRYLQTFDLARARESVGERRTLARIAPHTVSPLRFVLPLTRSLTKGRLAMRAGFLLDRLVAFDRNAGVPADLRLPAGCVVGRGRAVDAFPGVPRTGLTGAATWYDYVTVEPDRLTFSYALAADAQGAVLANYVEATGLVNEPGRVTGVQALDRVTGRAFTIGARVTVNATGASIDRLLAPLGLSTRIALLKAMNVVTSRPAGDHAIGARTASGRVFFLVPWHGRALLGTWESATTCAAGDLAVTATELGGFIAELNRTFPALDLRRDEVTLVHRGIVPAAVGRDGSLALEGHEQVRDHALDSPRFDGLLSVAGTKYTTARAVAARLCDQLFAKLGRPPAPCRTATVPLPGGQLIDVAEAVAAARHADRHGLRGDVLPHLFTAYGARASDVLSLVDGDARLGVPLSDESPVIGAELLWAARHEAVVHLADAVIRRTRLGALGDPGAAALDEAARLVGDELSWTDGQRRDEIERVRGFYSLEKA